MPGDVFEKDPFGFDLEDDPGDVGPQVPFVIVAFSLSRMAERLAGVSGEDGIEGAPEGYSVEGGDVIPDWGGGEVSCPLGGDDGLAGISLPLDEAARMKAGFGEHEAHIQSSAACAEGEAVSGMWHHVICDLRTGFHHRPACADRRMSR